MSNIITARDIGIVTGEIKYVQRRAARQLLSDLIEIGRLLVEAKSMVPYGEWGKYLEEQVEYSTSQANNLMRLYNEYGDNQETFFSTLQNSQTFGKLTYTQALALIALPAEDRAEFAEKHDVENMSTRELERAIRDELANAQKDRDEAREELDEVRCGKEAAEKRVVDLEEELAESHRQEHAQQEAAQLARDEVSRLNEELERARKQSDRSGKEAVKLRQELDRVKAAAKSSKEQLEQLKTNPKIPAAMMRQLQLEAEQEAARKATVDLQKQLDAAAKEKTAAEEKTKDLEAKLADARRTAKMSDPVITETIVRAKKLQNDFNELNGLRLKQLAANTEESIKTAGTMRKIMADMVEQMLHIVGK